MLLLSECSVLQKRGSEKGRIEISRVKAVEHVDKSAFERPYAFQVGCFASAAHDGLALRLGHSLKYGWQLPFFFRVTIWV